MSAITGGRGYEQMSKAERAAELAVLKAAGKSKGLSLRDAGKLDFLLTAAPQQPVAATTEAA